MFEMKEYHLRYEKGKLEYAEKNHLTRRWRDASSEPLEEFGKQLQGLIRRLIEKFPTKTMDVNVTSW